MKHNMFVFCKYTERAILQMLSENKIEEIQNPVSMTIECLKCRADFNTKLILDRIAPLVWLRPAVILFYLEN